MQVSTPLGPWDTYLWSKSLFQCTQVSLPARHCLGPGGTSALTGHSCNSGKSRGGRCIKSKTLIVALMNPYGTTKNRMVGPGWETWGESQRAGTAAGPWAKASFHWQMRSGREFQAKGILWAKHGDAVCIMSRLGGWWSTLGLSGLLACFSWAFFFFLSQHINFRFIDSHVL